MFQGDVTVKKVRQVRQVYEGRVGTVYNVLSVQHQLSQQQPVHADGQRLLRRQRPHTFPEGSELSS